MKKVAIILISFFFLSSFSISQQWYQLYPDIDKAIWDVFCIDAYNVYFTTYYGPLLKTTDGGISWEIFNDLSFGNAIYFVNKDTGYVAGVNSSIYRTENGGDTWIVQSIDTSFSVISINDIKMISSDTIIISASCNNWNEKNSAEIIYISYDAGLSWTNIFASYSLESNIRIHFFNNGVGFVLESNWESFTSKIHKTINLGATWNEIAMIEDIANEIYFIDTITGFIGGELTAYNQANIYKTSDGGISWNIVDVSEAQFITKFDFPDPSTGYFAGHFEWSKKGFPWGLVEMSGNGGNSWDEIFFSDVYSIRSLDFVTVDSGYIVGEKSTGMPKPFIMRTFDVELSKKEINDSDKTTFTVSPNPFNKHIKIKYKTTNHRNLKLVIFDIYNNVIKRIAPGMIQDDEGTLKLDLHDEPSGIYFCTLYYNDLPQKTIKIIKIGL